MLLLKLKLIECVLEKDTIKNMEKLNRVIKLQSLLLKINFKVELVPEYSYNKLLLLLNDINEGHLTHEEAELLEQVVNEL